MTPPPHRGLLLMLAAAAAGVRAEIQLLAVIDQRSATYEADLASAVAYVNSEGGGGGGERLALRTILSTGNDSLQVIEDVCTELQNGADIILDLSPQYVTASLRSLAEAAGIPHVASVDPSYYEAADAAERYNGSVTVLPAAGLMLAAVRDVVRDENLTKVAVIYDSSFDLADKPKRLLRNLPAQHLYLRMVTGGQGASQQLDQLKAANLAHVFLACSARNAREYLATANERGMMSFKMSWYVLSQDALVTCPGCEKEAPIIALTAAPRNPDAYVRHMASQQPGFTQDDIQVSSALHFDLVRLLAAALAAHVTRSPWQHGAATDHAVCPLYTAAAGGQTDATTSLLRQQAAAYREEIKKVSVGGVLGQLLWRGDAAETQLSLTITRLQIQDGGGTSTQAIGDWSASGGLTAYYGTITNTNVKKTYRIVTVKEPPFIFKTSTPPPPDKGVKHVYYNETSRQYYYGYCIDLIFKINETMGFDFELYEPGDGAYGSMQPDGSWNGMVSDLIQDRADIIVAPLSVMAERENVIDFTVPYYDLVGITILMKKVPFQYSLFRFMSVLEEAVWGCVLSAFIIVSILLAIFDKYSPYSYQNNRDSWDGQGDEPRVFSLKEGLWFCMTSLTPQGGGEAPRALSGRLVAATWWVFGFIMIATYTANLAAFLTVSRLDQPIESLDDLAKQFKTKYAPQESTSTETYFRRMADIEDKFYTIWKSMSLNDSLDQVERAKLAVWDYPVSDKFTNMWASMEAAGFPRTKDAAVERIKNPPEGEEFAFIGDATQNKYTEATDCNLWVVGEEFSRKPYALAVQEGAPLKNDLSAKILQLLNQRVLEDLKTTWWDFNKTVCDKREDETNGISINNIGGVFLVIFIGIGLGLITLAFEYYWYKWRPAAQVKASLKKGSDKHTGPASTGDQNGYTNGGFNIST